jgi:hypothetical protein
MFSFQSKLMPQYDEKIFCVYIALMKSPNSHSLGIGHLKWRRPGLNLQNSDWRPHD